MNNYEWYKPEIGDSYMCIGKCRIGLSKKLFEDMDKPKYVQLGYWDKTKSIVIKPCDENSKYKIKIKSGKYPPRINNKGFIGFIINKGIKLEDKARRYKAIWDEENKVVTILNEKKT